MTTLQIILIASISFLIFALIIFIAMNMVGKKKKKNIELIRGQSGGVVVDEKDIQNKRRAEIARKLKSSRDDEDAEGYDKTSLATRLQQAGSNMTVKRFWLFSFVCGGVCALLAKLMSLSVVVTILIFITGTLGVPRFILRSVIKRRQKKFLQEFADALDAVVRLLKAGMPVSEAVAMISKEFDGPIGEEMSIIYDKQKIGIPLHEAAFEGTRRMPLPEMQMFAAGLAIQAQTGSSLSEVLMNLSNVIRARFRLKRKIMALSSEAIASAGIIGMLPPLVAFGLWAVNPEYLEPLFTTSTGKMLITGAVLWMGIGVLVMRQMINFKI